MSEELKPGRSTGPRTPNGKANSSMNRLTHGCCSPKTILRDESEAEFAAHVQSWLAIYSPQDRKEDELVNEIIHAHWLFKRAKLRLAEVEYHLPGDAWNWTDDNQKLFANFTRYKTTAERAFARWYKEMEAHRGRQFRQEQILEKARLAAAQVEATWLTDAEKNTNKALKVTQIVEIDIEDGETVTECFPDNQEILEGYEHRETKPIFIKRLLLFLKGVPPEYSWTNPKQGDNYPQAVQNILWNRWLDVIDQEEIEGSGHLGPIYTTR